MSFVNCYFNFYFYFFYTNTSFTSARFVSYLTLGGRILEGIGQEALIMRDKRRKMSGGG